MGTQGLKSDECSCKSTTGTFKTFSSPRERDLEAKTLPTLQVKPRYPLAWSALEVFFSEHWDGQSASSIPPTVLVYNMVDENGEAFGLVLSDDSDALLELLAYDKATIQDCDESGRGLLRVSSLASLMLIC